MFIYEIIVFESDSKEDTVSDLFGLHLDGVLGKRKLLSPLLFFQLTEGAIAMPKILIVEDEEVIRKDIKKLIRSFPGATSVIEAEHGKAALGQLHADIPDLIITDIRMREMDGISFIKKARNMLPDIPIMIISGYGEFEYAQFALRYGVCEYILKPINRKLFFLALERIFPSLDYSPTTHLTKKNGFIISRIKTFILANIEGDLTLQSLAEQVNLHPTYISHLFRNETAMTITDYITQVRMEKAKYLLSATTLKIYDIALLSGYQSPKHFMLVFKQQTGKTPTGYRNGLLE